MRSFKEMVRYGRSFFKGDQVGVQDVPDIRRPKRATGTWKYRRVVSGQDVYLKRIRRPSFNTQLDTRPRKDGKPNCPECGHNRFKTDVKFPNGQRLLMCRNPECNNQLIGV